MDLVRPTPKIVEGQRLARTELSEVAIQEHQSSVEGLAHIHVAFLILWHTYQILRSLTIEFFNRANMPSH